MLRNYLVIALRGFRRHAGYTFVNVFGLALSLSVCLLILLLVREQMSYDRFHEGADRTVRVITARPDGDGLAATPGALAPAVEAEVPGVEAVTRIGQIRTNALVRGTSVSVQGLYAEPAFFDVFDFSLQAGDAGGALVRPGTLLLSEAGAARLFGEEDPVGRTLTLEDVGDFTVAGVVQTRGLRSHLRFDVLASFASLAATPAGRAQIDDADNFWTFATYVRLEPGAPRAPLTAFLEAQSARYAGGAGVRFRLQPLTGITLGPMLSNEISSYSLPLFVVLFLGGLGAVVMLAAGFNYVGLTTARALGRAREVGVRKAVGAARRQVMAQFLAESVLTALGALVLAYTLLAWLIPGFNGLSAVQTLGAQVTPSMVYDPALLAVFVAFTVAVGVLAGLYPAVVLSGFEPARVLKGAAGGRSGMRVRKVLTVAQLTLSLVFIVTTLVVFRQFALMTDFDYGFRADDVLRVELQGNDAEVLRDELLRDGSILAVSAVSEPPATGSTAGALLVHEADTLQVTAYSADAAFTDVLKVPVLAGTGLAEDGPGVVLNETAARALGYATPSEAVGAVVLVDGFLDAPQPVVGVAADYQFNILLRGVEPLVLYRGPEAYRHLLVRHLPGRDAAAEAHARDVWARVDPVHPPLIESYGAFLRDNQGTRLFRDLAGVVGLVALIALAIACLGLLAMAAYAARTRTREVGIRKVLGADVPHVVWLLGREFAGLLAVAVVLAVPLAWFLNRQWLDLIANRVPLGAGTLAAGVALVLVVALAAVGTQAVRAALADPAAALRYE